MRVDYYNILEYVSESESRFDFLERMEILSNIIMLEFHNRIHDKIFGFQIAEVIDDMNNELHHTIRNINTMVFVQNQPEIQEDVLFNLIKIYNPDILEIYNQHKFVICN